MPERACTIVIAETEAQRAACFALRRAVFIDEQGVSEADEVDGEDPDCHHILASVDGTPVGAARYRMGNGVMKIQRVCVAKAARGTGLGRDIILFAIDRAMADQTVRVARLGAQVDALEFYRRLGFSEVGEVYMDAGIPHRDMERAFT